AVWISGRAAAGRAAVTATQVTEREPRPCWVAAEQRPVVDSIARLRVRSLSLSVRLAAVFTLVSVATILLIGGVTVMVARAHLGETLDRQLLGTAQSFQRGPGLRARSSADLTRETRRWLAEHPPPVGQTAAHRRRGGTARTR